MENFIIKVVSLVFIYRSEDFQSFIKDPKEYTKIDVAIEDNLEISKRYQLTFPHVSLKEFDEESIEESLGYFKSLLMKLRSFETICAQCVSNYELYARSLAGVFDKMNEVGKFLADKESTVILREECINPYGIIQDWLINEVYDIKAIIKAIKSRTKFSKIILKFQEIAKNHQKNFDKFAAGKKKFLQKISSQSESEYKSQLESSITSTQHELSMIKTTANIISCRLVKIEIPYFRKAKMYHFNTIIRAFINANFEEFTSLVDQSKHTYFIHNSN